MLRTRLVPQGLGVGPMMAYTFDPSPIYAAGQVASAWFVALALFALLAFA